MHPAGSPILLLWLYIAATDWQTLGSSQIWCREVLAKELRRKVCAGTKFNKPCLSQFIPPPIEVGDFLLTAC